MKTGAGKLTISSASEYTGATVVEAGTLALTGNGSIASSSGLRNDGVFDISGLALATTGTSIKTLSGSGVVQLGTKRLTLTAASDTFSGIIQGDGGLTVAGGTQVLTGENTFAGLTDIDAGATLRLGDGGAGGGIAGSVLADGTLVFNRSDDLDFGGVITGSGAVDQLGSGMTTLSADSSAFAGLSTVHAGTLQVNGVLGGLMDVRGGRLQGIGTVGATHNYAGGVIAPGNSIGTLTVDGDYTLTVDGDYTSAGGALEIEAKLGDDGSPTDLLIITGDSILGTGPTQVRVINVGGAGAETTGDGIRIVQVDGASAAGAFVLNGPAIGGAYSYNLFQNGITDTADGDWYLRAAGLAPTTPVYENYPQVLLGMVELPTLQQRVGNRYWSASADGATPRETAIWTRVEGAHSRVKSDTSTSDARYDADTALVQAGFDGLLSENAAGMLLGGLTAQYGHADADIYSGLGDGANSTESYGIGATLTWYGANGFYVDGQAQVTLLRSDLSAAGVGVIGDGLDGSGYALSLEAGRKLAVGGGWSLTPQAQLAWSSVDFDRFTDPFGADVSLTDGDSLKGRLGLSVDFEAGADRYVYAVANATYEFLDGAAVAVSGVDLAFEPQRFGAELGLGGTYRWGGGKYALNGEALASTSFEGSYSYKGTLGLTAGF